MFDLMVYTTMKYDLAIWAFACQIAGAIGSTL
jgi:hypothetical protein